MSNQASKQQPKQRIVIYGGSGFVGSHIAEGLSQQDEFCVLCLSRTGHKPTHLRDSSWSEKVRWCEGDALNPDHGVLTSADVLIVSIGSPPIPTLSQGAFDAQLRQNGESNKTVIEAALAAGVTRLVLIGAHMPSFLKQDWFAYAKGKQIALSAAENFANASSAHQAMVLQPGVVSGVRYTNSGIAINLRGLLMPLAALMPSQVTKIERIVDRCVDFVDKPSGYNEGLSVFAQEKI